MANALTIITNALARLGAVGADRNAADADKTLALNTLRDMLRRHIYSGALGTRRTVEPDSDYTPGENEHVYRTSLSVQITLPDAVTDDGCTISDYGETTTGVTSRSPRDGAFIIITDKFTNNTLEFIYDGPRKTWTDISNLDLTTVVPFALRDSSGLSAALACELADYFGAEISPATFELQRRFKLGVTNQLTEDDVSNVSRGTYF